MTTATIDPEGAVRQYLTYLSDPHKLVDHAAITQIKAQAETAADPIDRLKAIAKLQKAEEPDGSEYLDRFVRYAQDWAEANEVNADAFRQLGVSNGVLRAAGLLSGGKRTTGSKHKTTTRSKSVSSEEIKTHVLTLAGPFTLAELMATIGGSPMTVRKAIDELVKTEKVTRLGTDKAWTGRGRAPILYQTV